MYPHETDILCTAAAVHGSGFFIRRTACLDATFLFTHHRLCPASTHTALVSSPSLTVLHLPGLTYLGECDAAARGGQCTCERRRGMPGGLSGSGLLTPGSPPRSGSAAVSFSVEKLKGKFHRHHPQSTSLNPQIHLRISSAARCASWR